MAFHAHAANQPVTNQPVTDRAVTAPADATIDVAIGIAGVWKIGHVTPIRVSLPAALAARAAAIEVSTFDGDGVEVTYLHRLLAAAGGAATDGAVARGDAAHQAHWCEVTIGRSDRPLGVRVIDAAGQRLAERKLDGNQLGQALPPTQPWIVALGSSMGVEATSHSLTTSGLPSFSTTVVTDPRAVPDSWRAFSGCDVLIVSTTHSPEPNAKSAQGDSAQGDSAQGDSAQGDSAQGDSAQADSAGGDLGDAADELLVASLHSDQWQAIDDWISHGGSAVISLGDYAERLSEDAPLRRMLPGRIVEEVSNVSTSPLEASTATNVQLAPIGAVRLDQVRGAVELSMLDNTGKRFAWWVRYTIGKGVVHYIGSDLDQPVLRQWKDRALVWDKLLSSLWSREQQSDAVGSGRNISSGSAYLGYEDMVGQLRATLDHFPTARIYSFGEVTFLLTMLLLIIGPLDYWVSVRWLRRPDFSWYLAGTVLVVASAGLIWSESAARPRQLLVNSAQVVDFIPEQQRALAESWTHVYSSRARTIDCTLQTDAEALDQRLDWQGLPGKGLGGMESNLLSDQGMPAYWILVPPAAGGGAGTELPQGDRTGRAAISSVGIPASGTKCLYASWSQEFTPLATSQLKELQGIDQIEGVLANPLPQDLLRPALMYHNWVYQLPSRLRAGEELSVTYEMVPKDLMRRLNRRQITGNTDQITPWVPEDRQSIDRLLEIMMFYKASGGAAYTRLQHRFQPRMDISNALTLEHAVLFGELAEPLGGVAIDNLPADQVQQETNRVWCRVLLPVARPEQ